MPLTADTTRSPRSEPPISSSWARACNQSHHRTDSVTALSSSSRAAIAGTVASAWPCRFSASTASPVRTAAGGGSLPATLLPAVPPLGPPCIVSTTSDGGPTSPAPNPDPSARGHSMATDPSTRDSVVRASVAARALTRGAGDSISVIVGHLPGRLRCDHVARPGPTREPRHCGEHR